MRRAMVCLSGLLSGRGDPRRSIVFIVLAVMAAGALHAQDRPRHERKGLWIAAGAGSAWNDLSCTGCQFTGPEDPWRGGSGSGLVYSAGWSLSQHLLLGVELNPSGTGDANRTATIFMLLLVAQYYPWASGGFHVKAGAGLTSVLLSGMGSGAENYGRALQAGVGYDVRFRRLRGLAFTPFASYAATSFREGNITVSGNAGPVTALQNRSITQIGLVLAWY